MKENKEIRSYSLEMAMEELKKEKEQLYMYVVGSLIGLPIGAYFGYKYSIDFIISTTFYVLMIMILIIFYFLVLVVFLSQRIKTTQNE